MELDKMWHYVKKKQQKLWIWKALDQETGQLLDWECGRRNKATLKQMMDRLAQWDVTLYCTYLMNSYYYLIETFPCIVRPSRMRLNQCDSLPCAPASQPRGEGAAAPPLRPGPRDACDRRR